MMDRFSDNDLIQEYFEELVSAGAKDLQPTFLLDDDLTVRWANQPAHRDFPAFTEPQGIINILCDFEEEKEKLVSENETAVISLDTCSKRILRIKGHIIGGRFRIYKGVITEQADLNSMSDEEAERYIIQHDIDFRGTVLTHLLHMKLWPGKDLESEKWEMYNTVVQNLLEGYRLYKLFHIGQFLSRKILKHTTRRIDLRAFINSVLLYAEDLIIVFTDSELLYSIPTARVIVDTEPDYILTVLAQLISNAIKYRADNTPIQVSMILRENKAEILVINGKEEHDSTIQYGLGLDTAAKLAEFIGGSLAYRLDKYHITFRFTIPLHLDKKHQDMDSWTQADESEMRARFCVNVCDAIPIQQELIMML